MRTVDKIKAPQDYFKYFQSLITSKKAAMVWQLDENSQKRSLYRVIMLSCRREEDTLKAENLEKGREFSLPREDVYFYVESHQLLFKSPKMNLEDHIFSCVLPNELKVLNEDEHEKILEAFAKIDPTKKELLLDYTRKKKAAPEYEVGEAQSKGYEFEVAQAAQKENHYQEVAPKPQKAEPKRQSDRDREIFETELSFVALDEEDKIYADKRDAPRARPPEGKMVSMQLADGSKPAGAFTLFDLSRGGVAVLAFSEDEYQPGDVVHIQAFDEKILDEPMVVEVKSVRPADEHGVQFKIGMMFI